MTLVMDGYSDSRDDCSFVSLSRDCSFVSDSCIALLAANE